MSPQKHATFPRHPRFSSATNKQMARLTCVVRWILDARLLQLTGCVCQHPQFGRGCERDAVSAPKSKWSALLIGGIDAADEKQPVCCCVRALASLQKRSSSSSRDAQLPPGSAGQKHVWHGLLCTSRQPHHLLCHRYHGNKVPPCWLRATMRELRSDNAARNQRQVLTRGHGFTGSAALFGCCPSSWWLSKFINLIFLAAFFI